MLASTLPARYRGSTREGRTSRRSNTPTRTEFDLLQLLLANRGQVFSRQELIDSVWQDVVVTDRTVDVNITRLRKKLGPYASNIANRQGFGYYFDEKAS